MTSTLKACAIAAVAALTFAACQEPPDLAKEHRIKGHKLLEEGKYEDAAKEYDLALQVDPKQEKVWEQKAFALSKAGKQDDAAAALVKVAEFKADTKGKADVYRNIAGMYLQSPNPAKSEQYFLEVLKMEPNDEASLNWMGELFSQLGGARAQAAPAVPADLEKAIAYYDKALAINPSNLTPLANKRIALTKYGQYFVKQRTDAENTLFTERAKKKKADKAIIEDSEKKLAEAQARIAEIQKGIDETTAKLSEVLKAQKAAKEAAAAAPAGTQPAAGTAPAK